MQLESQLQQDELQQHKHHDTHQQRANGQVSNIEVDSHHVACTGADLHAEASIQPSPPKPIIRPWEELVHNKHKTGFGYDKELSFHIPDYSKPIKFQSVGFLHDSSHLVVLDPAPFPQ